MYYFTNLDLKIDEKIVDDILQLLDSLLYKLNFVIDSRLLNNESIFCAYKGTIVDARDFIVDAINKRVPVILYEAPITNHDHQKIVRLIDQISQIKDYAPIFYSVHNLMHYIGILLSIKYNTININNTLKSHNHYNILQTIAVTGTNGKTSITSWLAQAYYLLNKKVALVGTNGVGVYPDIHTYNNMTTPDAVKMHELLNNFGAFNLDCLAIEASSHALDQGRINGLPIKTAIFTNLTPDHLDYHQDMEHYYLAKKKLFYWNSLKFAIINIDDQYGLRLYDELKNSKNFEAKPNANLGVYTYGILENELSSDNEFATNINYKIKNYTVYASDIEIHLQGMSFNIISTLNQKIEKFRISVNLIGRFNIYNLLALSLSLLLDSYSLSEIVQILPQLLSAKGRMEIVKFKPTVIVDYAHTPDALYNTLYTLRNLLKSSNISKLYLVFGCGGNRDQSKRNIMYNIAKQYADYVIITSDNPRYEKPLDIIAHMLTNKNNNTSYEDNKNSNCNYEIIVDRCLAITTALNLATINDVVLIAGKGHELYQEINGIKHFFSDFDVIKKYYS